MRRRDANSARTAWLVVAGLVVFMLVLAGCGSSSSDSTGGGGAELQKVGKGEGELNLISWAGYVEPEWVKPFEAETGCKVNNKTGGTSDEMVQLMGTGEYDGARPDDIFGNRSVPRCLQAARRRGSRHGRSLFRHRAGKPAGLDSAVPHAIQ